MCNPHPLPVFVTKGTSQMKTIVFALAVAVAGCASDIMQGYVGRDITAVIANYGEPHRRFQMPDGRIAYQWRITEINADPGEIEYTQERNGTRVTGHIISYDGFATTDTCFYTFYTSTTGYGARITGFEEPSFECE